MQLQHVLIYLLPSSGGSLTRSSTPAEAQGRPQSTGRWIAAAARGTMRGGVQCNVQGTSGSTRHGQRAARGSVYGVRHEARGQTGWSCLEKDERAKGIIIV
jgi:hypothetical protein